MVNYCVCAGCANSSLSGHRVHHFPGRKSKSFRAWVRFVQVKRANFTAASVTSHSVICGAHFTSECYQPGDLMEFKMGFRSLDRVRLINDAVPSVHSTESSSSASAELPTDSGARGNDGANTGGNSLHRKRDLSRMVLVKEEREEHMSEPETWSIKQEEPETWRIKQEEQEGLVKVKEERPDLNEVEEKHQVQKDHDVIEEKAVSCSNQKTDVKKPFSCSQCGNTYKHKGSLTQHMRIHTGENAFSCSQCGKSFAQKGHFEDHLVTHSSKKAFTCSECGKSFRRKGYLKYHMLFHTGKMPFSCSHCGRSFTRRGYLKDHLVTHSSEKPFTCTECGKSFTRKGYLQTHMLFHTGKMPFTCSQCEKSFICKGILRNHMLIHTGERPFSCSECGKTFTQKGHLKAHAATHLHSNKKVKK